MRRLPLLMLLLAGPALAQPPGGATGGRDRGPMLGRQGPTIVAEPIALVLAGFDGDQDGLVTRAEAIAGAARSFAAVANGASDIGFIGYSTWCQRWLGDPNAAPGPYEVDADHDQRITRAELTAAVLGAFDRFDVNHDGTLTRAELVTVRATAFGDDGRGGKGKKGKPPQP